MLYQFLSVLAITSVFGTPNNPFEGVDLYVDAYYASEVATSIALHPSQTAQMQIVANTSSAYWIDSMAHISNVTGILDNAQAQMQKTGNPTAVMFVIYDVPDRDCAAAASNGEIVCADSTCTAGIQEYETNYIAPILTIFQKYPKINLILVIEPDSLPNLATNMDLQQCQQAATAYKTCISYAIKTFNTLPNVVQYVDAAHGGWLGWQNNQDAFVPIVRGVLENAGGLNVIRGFASNTANYQPLGSLTSTADPCNLESQYNFCINEAIYIEQMTATFAKNGMSGYYWITDTGRNAAPANERSDCSNWCNINHSGIGQRPGYKDVQSITGSTIIDAFVWVKPPGESDGTSNTSAHNYDFHCGSSDSLLPAPQAGTWFDAFFSMVVGNANPPLS